MTVYDMFEKFRALQMLVKLVDSLLPSPCCPFCTVSWRGVRAASTILVFAIATFRSYDKNRDKKQHARLVIILLNFL